MFKRKIRKAALQCGNYIFPLFPSILIHRLPRTLVIEPTNVCMLHCRACATVNNPVREKGYMPLSLFRKILRQIDWDLKTINFSYAGEPLLNRDIFKMIKLANEKRLRSNIETNGMLLEERADEILDSGLCKLNIAFDGISQDSVSKYRKGIDFTRVISGINHLVQKKKKLALRFPEIHLQFIVMKHNELEIPEAIRIAQRIGVESIDFKSFILTGGIWLNRQGINAFAEEYLPKNEKFSRYSLQGRSWVLKKHLQGVCPYAFSAMVIMWDGNVTACTMDVNGDYIVGNLNRVRLRDIWLSNNYTELRKNILTKKAPQCKECAYLVDHFIDMRTGK